MYELIKIIFLENVTVGTNKMKFWRSIKRGQIMRKFLIAKEGGISVYPFSLITDWMSDWYFQLK